MDILPATPRHPDLFGKDVLKRGLNSFHEALADFILMNPASGLKEKALYFGYSIGWISMVENSDMFRAYMGSRRKEVQGVIAESLPAKLEAAAHLATERIMEVVATSNEPKEVIDAFDKILHRYGYAPNAKNGANAGGINQNGPIQNNFYLGATDLADARKMLMDAHAPKALEIKAEGESENAVSTT